MKPGWRQVLNTWQVSSLVFVHRIYVTLWDIKECSSFVLWGVQGHYRLNTNWDCWIIFSLGRERRDHPFTRPEHRFSVSSCLLLICEAAFTLTHFKRVKYPFVSSSVLLLLHLFISPAAFRLSSSISRPFSFPPLALSEPSLFFSALLSLLVFFCLWFSHSVFCLLEKTNFFFKQQFVLAAFQ